MAVKIPSWLTKDYLQNALQFGKDYSVNISHFNVDMAVPKGNNFVCNVYRVSVEYTISKNIKTSQKISLIIKEPIYGPMYEAVLKLGIETEVKFYNILAPQLNSIFGVNEANEYEEENMVFPRSYYSTENNIIILEDLKPKGYLIVDRVKRFDYDHCVIALKALAKFHAGTKVLTDKEPYLIELFKVIMSTDEMKKKLGPFFMSNFKNLADEFKTRPDLAKYSDWLYENYETGLDKGFELLDPRENEFNVLIHGDFGLQNLLVKYSDNIPTKILPIDYQTCKYTSPLSDFFCLTELNTQEDVRSGRFDELVNVYVTEINYNLEKYGSSNRLDESEFRKYIEERSYLRVFLTVAFLSLAIGLADDPGAFKLDDFTPDNISKTGKTPSAVYVKNENFIKIIAKRFEEFEQKGLVTIKL